MTHAQHDIVAGNLPSHASRRFWTGNRHHALPFIRNMRAQPASSDFPYSNTKSSGVSFLRSSWMVARKSSAVVIGIALSLYLATSALCKILVITLPNPPSSYRCPDRISPAWRSRRDFRERKVWEKACRIPLQVYRIIKILTLLKFLMRPSKTIVNSYLTYRNYPY